MILVRTMFHVVTVGLALMSANSTAQQTGNTPGAPVTAESIMERVAQNQDRMEAERSRYLYVQHARVVSRKGKTVMCEEVTDTRITPSASSSHAELLKLDGRLLQKNKYVTYTKLRPAHEEGASEVVTGDDSLSVKIGDKDTDRDLVEHMRANLTNDTSKDGLGARLFPLTSKAQRDSLFHLAGRERLNGREVFHITFQPKDKDEFTWKGDAYIDTAAYQPVVVRTAMARQIPFAVRTLLGTSLPGLGFTVIYAPQPDGVWFPVSFGTEFKLRIFFFFNRQIVIDAQNRDFEKTHVTSRVLDHAEQVAPR